MGVASKERITRAQTSSDLGEIFGDEVADIDIVRACGAVGATNPLGLAIWRWHYAGDQREVFAVAQGLVDEGFAEPLVHRVLAHLMSDLCDACGGRGYQQLPAVPVLSDELCLPCRGTGRRLIEGAQERDLVERIAQLEREVAAAVMKKLAAQMEF